MPLTWLTLLFQGEISQERPTRPFVIAVQGTQPRQGPRAWPWPLLCGQRVRAWTFTQPRWTRARLPRSLARGTRHEQVSGRRWPRRSGLRRAHFERSLLRQPLQGLRTQGVRARQGSGSTRWWTPLQTLMLTLLFSYYFRTTYVSLCVLWLCNRSYPTFVGPRRKKTWKEDCMKNKNEKKMWNILLVFYFEYSMLCYPFTSYEGQPKSNTQLQLPHKLKEIFEQKEKVWK